MMSDSLLNLFNRIRDNSNLLTASEAQTSQGIVLPILNDLGWQVFDTNEVNQEFTVGGKRVDFALRIKSVNKVFIEIKKTSENLDNHQEQLVYYAFQQGVKLAILTNGITWQFYLPLEEGGWEQRRFFTIDLLGQSVDDSVERFQGLLSRSNIDSGSSYELAKSMYEGRQKNKIIRENLPKAWAKLVSEPDEMLVDLLNETLEKISGYKAESDQVIEFVRNLNIGTSTASNVTSFVKTQPTKPLEKAATGATPRSTIVLDPEVKIRDLLHTKVLEARMGDQDLPKGWNNILDVGLKDAFSRGMSFETVKSAVNINMKSGDPGVSGFNRIAETNYFWQNQDSNYCANNAVALAKLLGKELYVEFMWKEKGKFPLTKGIISWKPQN